MPGPSTARSRESLQRGGAEQTVVAPPAPSEDGKFYRALHKEGGVIETIKAPPPTTWEVLLESLQRG